jgi:hypothetical protein
MFIPIVAGWFALSVLLFIVLPWVASVLRSARPLRGSNEAQFLNERRFERGGILS